MATRFYLQRVTAAAISPAYDGSWESTSQTYRRSMQTSKQSETLGYRYGILANVANTDGLAWQFVSEPLAAQTITGTVKGQAACSVSAGTGSAKSAIVIRVVSNDGSTVRGTLLAQTFGTGDLVEEGASGGDNRMIPPSTSLSSVGAQAGDRIVVEMGARRIAATGATEYGYIHIRDDHASDLADGDSTADETSGNPWIEFSQTLSFQGAAAMSTLQDNFDDNSTNGALWSDTQQGTATVAETNQRVECALGGTTDYGFRQSVAAYDLTLSQLVVELPQVLTIEANTETFIGCRLDADNAVRISTSGSGAIRVYKQVSGTWTELYSETYSAVNHRWLRISEASGTMYFSRSTNGLSWTTMFSVANPIVVTALYAEFGVGAWGSFSGPVTTAYFDNVNLTGGITAELPVVTFTLNVGGGLGVLHELPVVSFQLAPQDLYSQRLIALPVVTFQLAPQTLVPTTVGGGSNGKKSRRFWRWRFWTK